MTEDKEEIQVLRQLVSKLVLLASELDRSQHWDRGTGPYVEDKIIREGREYLEGQKQ